MYLTVFSVISFIINASLIFYIIKQNNTIKELEIKLKITRDYANLEAVKTLKAAKTTPLQAMRSEFANGKSVDTIEAADVVKKPTRRRKKKSNNNNNA